MLAIYEPKMIKCGSCGKESESYNRVGLCKSCYKTAFAIEEILVKKKVDWSQMKAKR